MAALHLDHNVARQLAQLLRFAGHDVVETRAIGMPRATDDALLLAAATTDRTFITHNEVDFALLHDAWRRWSVAWGVNATHSGILVLPQPPRLANSQAAQAVTSFLASDLPLGSELYVFHQNGGWRLRPAIRS